MPDTIFSADDLNLLRIAAIQYKRANNIKNSFQLQSKAKITCQRNALPRFLSGDTNDFAQAKELAEFLRTKGCWPYYDNKIEFYEMMSHFFEYEKETEIDKKMHEMPGVYEYYQWSSTKPGRITISEIRITCDDNKKTLRFCSVMERQSDQEAYKDEEYEGCCFSSEKGVVFVLRESRYRRPKIFILNKKPTSVIRYGLLLKTSSAKSLHLSNVVVKRIDERCSVNPRVGYLEDVDEDVRGFLQAPLTSLNLSLVDSPEELRSELELHIGKFTRRRRSREGV